MVFLSQLFQKQNGLIPIAEEMEQREKENTTLKDKLRTKEETENCLLDQIETLTIQMSQLSSDSSRLKNEKYELMEKCKFLEKKLEAQEQQYQLQISLLMEKCDEATEELRKEKMISESSEFNGQSLSVELEKSKSKQASLEYVIEHLKIERQRSDEHVARLRLLYNTYSTTESLCEAIYQHLTLTNIMINSSMSGFLTKKGFIFINLQLALVPAGKLDFTFSAIISSFTSKATRTRMKWLLVQFASTMPL